MELEDRAAGRSRRKRRRRKGILKKGKETVTPERLTIPCTSLGEPFQSMRRVAKGRHKGVRIAQSRGHWHWFCCNYYTSFNTSAIQWHPDPPQPPPPLSTHVQAPSEVHGQTSKSEGFHQRASKVSIFSGWSFHKLISLIWDNKEQYCDLTSVSCLKIYSPSAASHLTGSQLGNQIRIKSSSSSGH